MKLVVGGAYQGKLSWAIWNYSVEQDDIADGEMCSMEAILRAKLLNHFHLYIRRLVASGETLEQISHQIQMIVEKNPDLIIITDEIGLGIIPMEKMERDYREIHGRICCELAKKADSMVRVYAGIATSLL